MPFRLALWNLKKLFAREPMRPSPRRAPKSTLRFDPLEDRVVPSNTPTLTVGTASGNYHTISAAISAAPSSGATIDISAGTYTENLVLGKSGISLIALGNVKLNLPATVPAVTLNGTNIGGAGIDISGCGDLVSGITVNGAGSNVADGIRIINGGTATITGNTIENIDGSAVADANIGIDVGDSLVSGPAGGGEGLITGNTVTGYGGAGVLVDGIHSAGLVTGNTITGLGISNSGIAEYGIQVSDDATARVQFNSISGNTIEGSAGAPSNLPVVSAGIFFYNEKNNGSVAALNSVSGNDVGVLVQSSTGSGCNSLEIVNNDVYGNYGYAGIDVLSSSNVQVVANAVFQNITENGIALDYTNSVTVASNDVYSNGVSGSETDGIYDFEGTGDLLLANNSFGNSGNGINLYKASNLSIFNDLTWNNTLSGIQDYQGCNNAIWLGNSSVNLQNGIYLIGTNGDTVVGNVIASNGGWGIYLQGAKNSFIASNLVVGNQDGSILIDANSTGTTLINNWTSTPPVKDGTSGAKGCSSAFNNSSCGADSIFSGW